MAPTGFAFNIMDTESECVNRSDNQQANKNIGFQGLFSRAVFLNVSLKKIFGRGKKIIKNTKFICALTFSAQCSTQIMKTAEDCLKEKLQ